MARKRRTNRKRRPTERLSRAPARLDHAGMTTKIETTVAALIEAADNDNNEAAKVAAAKLASGALNDIRRIADALESIAEILLPK